MKLPTCATSISFGSATTFLDNFAEYISLVHDPDQNKIIIGYKDDANVSKGLQSHSCYSYQGQISVDQGFDSARISQKEFYIPHFKVVLVVVSLDSVGKANDYILRRSCLLYTSTSPRDRG